MVTWIPNESEWSEIVNRFLIQGHVRSYVATEALGSEPPQVIGFASISFETKVRGGVIGHIEDVVVDAIHRGGEWGECLSKHYWKRVEEETPIAYISSVPSRMSASTGLVVLSDPVSACVGEVANDDWTVQ